MRLRAARYAALCEYLPLACCGDPHSDGRRRNAAEVPAAPRRHWRGHRHPARREHILQRLSRADCLQPARCSTRVLRLGAGCAHPERLRDHKIEAIATRGTEIMNDQFVLGISAFYHDSAAALLRNGEIVAAG